MTDRIARARRLQPVCNQRLAEYEERRRLAAKRAKASPGKKQPIPGVIRQEVHGEPCRVCGTRNRIEAHHIVPRSAFPKHTPATTVHHRQNLMALCSVHHVAHHSQGQAYRVRRDLLRPTELSFIIANQPHAGWIDSWYPTPPPTGAHP